MKKGPNYCVSTSCTTGLHSVGDSYRMVRSDDADVMVCGGVDAALVGTAVPVTAGFCKVRALSTSFNHDPALGSRPFDARREGFIIGEGAGILVLEELQHARKRNAYIYGEILGYGMSGMFGFIYIQNFK